MIASKVYVGTDEHGVLRVGSTRVSLDSVVCAYLQGHSPETIREQYPALDLEDVYGAVAFYLANKAEVDQYLARNEQAWKERCRQQEQAPAPVVQRLRAMRNSQEG